MARKRTKCTMMERNREQHGTRQGVPDVSSRKGRPMYEAQQLRKDSSIRVRYAKTVCSKHPYWICRQYTCESVTDITETDIKGYNDGDAYHEVYLHEWPTTGQRKLFVKSREDIMIVNVTSRLDNVSVVCEPEGLEHMNSDWTHYHGHR